MAGPDPATQKRAKRVQKNMNHQAHQESEAPERLGDLGGSISCGAAAPHWVAGSSPAMTILRRAAIGLAAAAALTASAQAAPFDVYRGACLDPGVDLAKVRALATSQKWSALTEAEREQLAPGNGSRVEGWAIAKDNTRYLVSISGGTAGTTAGERSGASVASCGVLAPKSDDKAVAKSYSAYLKRQPSEDRADGMVTYTWSIQNESNVDYHYLVAGGAMPGISLSVSAIGK
jgi:hypothetical protein